MKTEPIKLISALEELNETELTLVAEDTTIDGKLLIRGISRIHGIITGEIIGAPGSTIILAESASVIGTIRCDQVLIGGFVRGTIQATTLVQISQSGRVQGTITAPKFAIENGGYFEGKCTTSGMQSMQGSATGDLLPAPA